ncbi:MAG: hypothetical protein AAF748_15720, partial [Pseudomonadota bacterium]
MGSKMATISEFQIINGITPITIFDANVNWNNGAIFETVFVIGGNAPDEFEANIQLTGANWVIDTLVFFAGSAPIDVNINGTAPNSFIATLEVDIDNGGEADLNLQGVQVNTVSLFGDGEATVRLGATFTNMVSANGVDDFTLIGGSGYIGTVESFDGDSSIFLQGGADSISLGAGTHDVTLRNVFVGSVQSFGGTANIDVGTAGVGSIRTTGGNDVITVDGNFEQIATGFGNDRVTLNDDIFGVQVALDEGNNIFRTEADGLVAVSALGGNDRYELLEGEIGSVTDGGGDNT